MKITKKEIYLTTVENVGDLRTILEPFTDECPIGITDDFLSITIKFEIVNNEGRIKLTS